MGLRGASPVRHRAPRLSRRVRDVQRAAAAPGPGLGRLFSGPVRTRWPATGPRPELIGLAEPTPGPVHVAVPHSQRVRRRAGLVVHRMVDTHRMRHAATDLCRGDGHRPGAVQPDRRRRDRVVDPGRRRAVHHPGPAAKLDGRAATVALARTAGASGVGPVPGPPAGQRGSGEWRSRPSVWIPRCRGTAVCRGRGGGGGARGGRVARFVAAMRAGVRQRGSSSRLGPG
jgi:hypothetical protein